jgi:leucyl/phenylalanyl-tRNA--protein transferase
MSNDIRFIRFPSVENATEDGLLAQGGDLNINTLISAYAQGIFPWFSEDQPILWWSPDPRMVLFPNNIKISRSLKKSSTKKGYTVSCNRDFESVINACALRGQTQHDDLSTDTWITQSMQDAYLELHKQGYAHSIEVWRGSELVGGLYGVVLGKAFFGESMFSRVSDGSKVALVALCRFLSTAGFNIIDCQVASEHLFSLGAVEISRSQFLETIDCQEIHKSMNDFSKSFKQVFPDNVINRL